MGLDNVYSTIKTRILATKPTPILGTAYHLVSEDEQQRATSTLKITTAEATAFQTYALRRKDSANQKRRREAHKESKQMKKEET